MESILVYQSGSGATKEIAHLFGFTPYGDYLKMKEQYKIDEIMLPEIAIELEEDVYSKGEVNLLTRLLKKKVSIKSLLFNTSFLRKMLRLTGNLVCVYCGKKDLIIYKFSIYNKNSKVMATADHFNPKSNGGDKYNYDNLVVSCHCCNNKKKSNNWSIRSLRYLSHYGNFKELVKNLIY